MTIETATAMAIEKATAMATLTVITMAMATHDNSDLLFISADDVTPLCNIFEPHGEEEELEEPLYLENIIMSPGKLSLVKDVTKDDLKHTPFLDPHYGDIQDKKIFICARHTANTNRFHQNCLTLSMKTNIYDGNTANINFHTQFLLLLQMLSLIDMINRN